MFIILFNLQRYESFLIWQNNLWRLALRAILPALAGGLQAFVQLTLQQLLGGQLGHVLPYIDAPSQSATTQ